MGQCPATAMAYVWLPSPGGARRGAATVDDDEDATSDQSAVDAARRGDRQATGRLLRALQDAWYRMCLGLLADADLARDAAQETAVRFLRQLPGFRGDSQVRTWALGIAINVAREMRRSPHVRTGGLEDWDAVGEGGYGPRRPAPRPAPDVAAEMAEQRDRLRAVL